MTVGHDHSEVTTPTTKGENMSTTTATAEDLASAVYAAVTAEVGAYATNPGGVTRIVVMNGYSFKVTNEDECLTYWFEDQNGEDFDMDGYVELPAELVNAEAAKLAKRLDELAAQ